MAKQQRKFWRRIVRAAGFVAIPFRLAKLDYLRSKR